MNFAYLFASAGAGALLGFIVALLMGNRRGGVRAGVMLAFAIPVVMVLYVFPTGV